MHPSRPVTGTGHVKKCENRAAAPCIYCLLYVFRIFTLFIPKPIHHIARKDRIWSIAWWTGAASRGSVHGVRSPLAPGSSSIGSRRHLYSCLQRKCVWPWWTRTRLQLTWRYSHPHSWSARSACSHQGPDVWLDRDVVNRAGDAGLEWAGGRKEGQERPQTRSTTATAGLLSCTEQIADDAAMCRSDARCS